MVASLEITSRERPPVSNRPAFATAEDIDGEILLESDLVDAGPEDLLSLPDGVDPEWMLGELWRDLIRGEHAKAVLAEAETRRVIEFNRSLEHQFVEGMGQLQARVPLDVYLHWCARYGPDFWRERGNLDFFAERNPGFIVKNFRRRTVVTVDQTLPARRGAEASAGLVETATAAGATPVAVAQPGPRVRGRRGRWAA